MDKCNSSYSVGDFAYLVCISHAGHEGNHYDGTIEWFNHCEHTLVSRRADGNYRFCNKCFTSEANL